MSDHKTQEASEDTAATNTVSSGAMPRDVTVTFTKPFLSYNAGEAAAFTQEEADRLQELGVTEAAPVEPPPEGGILGPIANRRWTGEPVPFNQGGMLPKGWPGADGKPEEFDRGVPPSPLEGTSFPSVPTGAGVSPTADTTPPTLRGDAKPVDTKPEEATGSTYTPPATKPPATAPVTKEGAA